jgi:hypothetical protein
MYGIWPAMVWGVWEWDDVSGCGISVRERVCARVCACVYVCGGVLVV